MNEEKSFFKKILISIKDFDKYPELASKSWTLVLSYFAKLLFIFTIIVSFTLCYNIAQKFQNSLYYIENEIPEFTFSNNKLKLNTNSVIKLENVDNVFDIIIDTSETNEEILNNYKEDMKKSNNLIIILQDKILLKTRNNKWNCGI